MPAVSERQRRFFGLQLARARAGEPTDVRMTQSQMRDFATKGRRTTRSSLGSRGRGRMRRKG